VLETLENVLGALSVPTILVVVGAILLTLSIVGKIGGYIEVPPQKQNIAGFVGAMLLAVGITLSFFLTDEPSAPEPPISRKENLPRKEPVVQQEDLVGQQKTSETYRVVNVSHWDMLNIRSDASADAKQIGTIPPSGQGIEIISGSAIGGWVRVRYRGLTGWVNSYYLQAE
jgi:hypothetical protein